MEMSEPISIAGLDKAAVLAALYNAARPLGMGMLHYTPEPMTLDEARDLLERTQYFDYVKGRVMKVRIHGDTLNSGLYDRDNGEGAAAQALAALTSTQETKS
jgi:hypothetical protein